MKLRSWLFVICFCVLFTGALGYIKFSQITAAIAYAESFPEPSETVEVVAAKQIQWQKKFITNASLVASQSVDLQNEIAGRIDYVGFSANSKIKSGQVLVALDDSVEQAELAGAKAVLELNKAKLQRQKMLVDKNLNAINNLDIAQADYSASLATVKALEAQIQKMTLKAPFDATAGLFQLEVGEYLDAGTIITRLVGNTGPLWVDFNLPQEQARLDIGDSISVFDPYQQDKIYPAKVIAADPWVKETSRNRSYRAELTHPPERFVPGMHTYISLSLDEPQNVISIPSTAIRYNELGANVFVLFKDEQGQERAMTRRVVVGEALEKNTIIMTGLTDGERVAANGAFKLSDGILVNAVELNSQAE